MNSENATQFSKRSLILPGLVPLLLLGLAFLWLLNSDMMLVFKTAAPPVEALSVERLFLDDEGIHLKIRAGGSEAMTIAQVQVDSAYWQFTQVPPGPLQRLSTAWLTIPYPWVLGDAHTLTFVTNTGISFEHVIEVAVQTPVGQAGGLRAQAVLGGFVGILPVALGMMYFPLMKRMASGGMQFILSVTLGMLAFLLIDLLGEAFKSAAASAVAFQGDLMVPLVAIITCLALISLGRRHGAPTGLVLASYVAFGIGLHNLGEGLAIGTAIATGASSLGAFLIIGFTLHNVTEGIAIAAPLVRDKPKYVVFAGLALLAGAPAIVGIWVGAYAVAPQWTAFAFAVGAGAIMQVLFEVGAYVLRNRPATETGIDRNIVAGIFLGLLVMYLTGLMIKV